MRKTFVQNTVLAAILALALTPFAFADPVAPEHQEAAPGHAGETLDPATKENFIAAYSDVLQVQNKYSQKLQTASDEQQARKLQEQAQQEMLQAVQANGMTPEEYNQVIRKVSTNPELQAEIEAEVK